MRNTRLWLRLWLALPAAALMLAVALAPASAAPATPEPKTKRMIVLFDDESAVANAARFAKILHRFKYLRGFVCDIPEGRLAALKSLPGVRRAEEDALIGACSTAPSDSLGTLALPNPVCLRWHHGQQGINATSAWSTHGVGGAAVTIAELDTGVNYTLSELDQYAGGYSWVDPDNNPIDDGVGYTSYDAGAGHGTQTTSIACARGRSLVAGVAYDADYYALKVLRSGRPGEWNYNGVPGLGQGFVSWAISAIDWCRDPAHKPDIINMSLGTTAGNIGGEYQIYMEACDRAYDDGIIIVAATGNDHTAQASYPAGYDNVIGVGALTESQNIAPYSNGGADLIAPGGDNISTTSDWIRSLGVANFRWKGTGTSYATPHVSGMFALMIQYARSIYSGRQNQMQLNNGYYWEAATHSCHDLGFDPLWQGRGKADAKLAIDLIASRWPINRSVGYSPITGSTLNCSTTITNILSNSVPTPIGEQIANLNVTATQAYYGENNEAPLPGTTPNKPVLTGGNLDLPGAPGATQVIDCSDSIDTANLPNMARTELKFTFSFVSDGRTMTITDPYAAIWDPRFISPTITSVVVSPARVAAGDTVRVTANASDNGNVASVTANGAALSKTGGNVWEGDIAAESALGSHTVTVVAKDEANLSATDTSASYRTDRVVCAGNLSVRNASIDGASAAYLFAMMGRVTLVEGDSFTIDDGSGQAVSVTAPGHSLLVGDYATARGVLNPGVNPPVLTATAAQTVKLN